MVIFYQRTFDAEQVVENSDIMSKGYDSIPGGSKTSVGIVKKYSSSLISQNQKLAN